MKTVPRPNVVPIYRPPLPLHQDLPHLDCHVPDNTGASRIAMDLDSLTILER